MLVKQLKETKEKGEGMDKKMAELQKKYDDLKKHYSEVK